MPYFLSPDVHVCVTDDCLVILSLRGDRYIGLKPAKSNRLADYVKAWPRIEPSDAEPPCEVDSARTRSPDALLSKMVAAGLLTTDPALGHDAAPASLDRPESVLVEWDVEENPRIHFTDRVLLVIACAKAAYLLRSQSLHSIVRRVSARRQRRGTDINLERVRRLTASFMHLRPLFFTARRKCLLDSLALLEFLALNREFPTGVIGVQTGPFVAHCWVQIGSAVCNDIPEHVRRYTPILTM
jgi:hypothetical protein